MFVLTENFSLLLNIWEDGWRFDLDQYNMIDQEVGFSCLFSLAIVWEDLGLKAHWKSVARLPLNIRLAGLTAGPPPSRREKKMKQCHSVVLGHSLLNTPHVFLMHDLF